MMTTEEYIDKYALVYAEEFPEPTVHELCNEIQRVCGCSMEDARETLQATFEKTFGIMEKRGQTVHVCHHCGKPMTEGYYLDGDYACSDECAIALYDGDADRLWPDLDKEGNEEYPRCYWCQWD